MRSMMTLALAAVAAAAPLQGQSIARRISQVDDGTVRLSYAAREGICGRGTSIITGPHSSMNWGDDWRRSSRDVEWDASCDEGPVRLVLTVVGGDVTAIRTYVGGRWRAPTSSTVDLGTVSAKEAADYLVGLADRVPGRVGRDAIFPSTIADSATVWPALLRLARNEDRPRQTRTQAVFWLGQMAGDKATEDLDALARDDEVNREVREQAVFALSQRPRDEGVPALIQIVRTSHDGELKKKALFWLGQSNDPRALALIEEILTRK